MRTTLILGILISFALVGCNQPTAADSAADGVAPKSAMGENDRGTAKVINDPSAVTDPNAAVRVVPANPDDPKFKMDPKLGGGN